MVTAISTSTRYAVPRTASPNLRRGGPDERNSTVVNGGHRQGARRHLIPALTAQRGEDAGVVGGRSG
jgi:hypothetical protein